MRKGRLIIEKLINRNISILEVWLYILFLFLFFPVLSTVFPDLSIDIGHKYYSSIITFICFVVIIYYFYIKVISLRKHRLPRIDLLYIFSALAVALMRFVALFSPATGFTTPILHDPLAHSLWAKSIIVLDKIDFFYSPLLHSISAMLSFGDITNIPLFVFATTQFAVFVIPIFFAALVYEFNKNLKTAILIFILLSTLTFPSDLYIIGGKNSLILGLSIIPSAVYCIKRYFHELSYSNAINVSLATVLMFFAHYPIFGIFIYLSIPWFISELASSLKKKNYKEILIKLLPILIATTVSIIWFGIFFYIRESTMENSVREITYEQPTFSFEYVTLTVQTVSSYFFKTHYKFAHIILLVPLFISRRLTIISTTIWVYFSLILLDLLIRFVDLYTELRIVVQTLSIIYPFVIFLMIALIVLYLLDKELDRVRISGFIVVVIGIISIVMNQNIGNEYLKIHKAFQAVDQNDLQAYEYINQNLPKDSKFINAGREDAKRKGIIFPVDGALWLPLYTNNETFINFMEFSSKTNNDNYKLFMDLQLVDDDKDTIAKIKALGFDYGYIDQGIYGHSLSIDFLNNIDYEIIFESGPVKIIKF